MHINFDFAATVGDSFKKRLPEWPAAFRNAALTVDAHGEPLNFRTILEDDGQGIAAVCSMRFRGEPFDVVIRTRTVGPLIGVCPYTQLEMETAGASLGGDEAKHLVILFLLFAAKGNRRRQRLPVWIAELHNAHAIVAGNLE